MSIYGLCKKHNGMQKNSGYIFLTPCMVLLDKMHSAKKAMFYVGSIPAQIVRLNYSTTNRLTQLVDFWFCEHLHGVETTMAFAKDVSSLLNFICTSDARATRAGSQSEHTFTVVAVNKEILASWKSKRRLLFGSH